MERGERLGKRSLGKRGVSWLGRRFQIGGMSASFSSHFRSASVHPDLRVTNANHLGRWRFGYDYTVDTLADSLSIKPHSVMGREKIDRWFRKGKKIAVGSAWVTLDRQLAEFSVKSQAALETYDLVRSFLFPDEAYFQTLLANNPRYRLFSKFRRIHCSHTHFDYENEGKVTPAKIDAAQRDGFLFCRKHLPLSTTSGVDVVLREIHGDTRPAFSS